MTSIEFVPVLLLKDISNSEKLSAYTKTLVNFQACVLKYTMYIES